MAAVSPLSSPHASPSWDATLTQALPGASLALACLRLTPVVLGAQCPAWGRREERWKATFPGFSGWFGLNVHCLWMLV